MSLFYISLYIFSMYRISLEHYCFFLMQDKYVLCEPRHNGVSLRLDNIM